MNGIALLLRITCLACYPARAMTRPVSSRLLLAPMLPAVISFSAGAVSHGVLADAHVASPVALSAAQTADAAAVEPPPVPQPPPRPVAPPEVTDPSIRQPQRIDNFIDYTVRTYGVDPAFIRATLARAVHQQKIIDAISRPAEAVKPWSEYRRIFLDDARIQAGRRFYLDNRAALERVAMQTGVPAEYIVAIIGVETFYGRHTGSWKVLDALYTLAFGYPKRAPFFAGELAQLFALHRVEPQLDLETLRGSYAGAMGMGQFMPSSYRLWAKDGDGDGRRDLLTHKPDVFASIANYFLVHGWQPGAPVAARARRAAGAADVAADGGQKSLEPIHSLPSLQRRGYTPQPGEPLASAAAVISLDGESGREYWLGYRNFYVISRYNHSPMYALAVHQLAQEIRAGVPAT